MSVQDQKKHLLQIFPDYGLNIVRGAGSKLWDNSGKEYIDCSSGWGVSNIGHSNPSLSLAIFTQAQELITCPGVFENPRREELASLLVDLAPDGLNQVFFTNSGTESVEAALKFAIASTGRKKVVSMMRGFHGRSIGSLGVTHKKKYRNLFEHLLSPDVQFVPFNNSQKLSDIVTEETAAVILELVQGEGGVHIADQRFVELARELCDKTGAILIFDEVQTGFGRTGRIFATDHFGVSPDILCLAKALGGGFPVGALLLSDKLDSLPKGIHGTTFGGNPLAMAAGIANLRYLIDMNIVEEVPEKGHFLMESLERVLSTDHRFRLVRGLGLMIAIEFKGRVQRLAELLIENGIIVIPTGRNTIRLLPPLIITFDEIRRVIKVFEYLSNDNTW